MGGLLNRSPDDKTSFTPDRPSGKATRERAFSPCLRGRSGHSGHIVGMRFVLCHRRAGRGWVWPACSVACLACLPACLPRLSAWLCVLQHEHGALLLFS